MSPLHQAQAWVAALLLGAALVVVPRAYRDGFRFLRAVPSEARLALGVVAASVVAGAALRAWLPLRSSTIFIGYEWTTNALSLYPLPRYGAGALGLYHAGFAVLPADHRSIMAINAVFGVLTVPLAAGFFARFFGRPLYGALVAPWLSLAPLIARNDTSDAKNVPALFFLFAGLTLLAAAADDRRARWLAIPPLCFAAVCRPELPVLVLMLGIVTVVFLHRRSRGWWGYVAVAAILVTPHLLHIATVVDSPEGQAGLPGLSWARVADAPRAFFRWNVPLDPQLFPVGALVFVVAGVTFSGRALRNRMLALLVVAVVAILLLLPDLDFANMARIEVPASVLVLAVAGAGGAVLLRRSDRRAKRMFVVVALVLGLLSGIPSAQLLFASTNTDAEDAAIRAALDTLPPGRSILLRENSRDRTDAHTHAHFPDYLVPDRVELWPLSAWDGGDDPLERPVYVYLGMRCFASFRPVDAPVPRGDNEQPHCRRFRRRFHLEPVEVRTVPNRGNVWIQYYGDAPQLTIGLYRVVGLREPVPP